MTKQDFLSLCQEYVLKKNGKCLSQTYKAIHEKLIWECEFGHIWSALPSNVKNGKWCPTCSRNKKLTLQDCSNYAQLKDGYCLSVEYVNAASNLTWQCKYGHIWEANFNNVKSKNSWCPQCSSNIGERICRIFFENFFDKPFSKTRPEWLETSTGSKLELDGFNSELKIAFEYQGIQHYEMDGFFVRSEEQLEKRIEYDLLKNKLCIENNVELIIVPYLKNLTDIDSIKNELTTILLQKGFSTQKIITIDLKKLYSNKIQKYKELAKIRGGKCLSDVYVNYYTKLTWCCSEKHIWDAVGYSIEKGHWCPDCAGNRKKII